VIFFTTLAAYVGESAAMYSAIFSNLEVPRETRLLDEPFAKPCFNFFLGESTAGSSVFQPAPYFVENVEVVLDVLDRAVIGEFLEEQLGVLLGGAHFVLVSTPKPVYTLLADVFSVSQGLNQSSRFGTTPWQSE
jgi:hypothetical protein